MAEAETGHRVKIVVTPPPEDPQGLYANHVQVSILEHDFVLDFVQLTPPAEDRAEELRAAGKLVAPAKMRVVLPISVLPGLAGALSRTMRQYAKDRGLEEPVAVGGSDD